MLTYVVGCRLPNDDDQFEKLDESVPADRASSAGGTNPLLRPQVPTPALSTHQRSNLSHVTLAETDDIAHPRKRANSDAQNPGAANLPRKDGRKPRKHRPLSWFPPLQRTSSQTTHLPKDSTSSTIGRSVISGPTLTSTTNGKVALSEGVPCGELATSGLTASCSHPESERIAKRLGGDIAKVQLHEMKETGSGSCGNSQPEQRSTGIRKMLKGTSRSASMNALFKVKDTLTVRLRQASDPQTYRSVFRKDKFVRLGDECRSQSPIDERLAQTKTEGYNFGKDKIRFLTGYGRVRKKPMHFPEQDSQESPTEEKKSLLFHTGSAEGHQTDPREQTLDLNFEDLEISFAKAVENLDFRMRQDKASFNSLSSFFHSAKHIAASNQTGALQTQLSQTSHTLPPSNSSHPHKLQSHQTSDSLVSAQPNMGQCASRVLKRAKGSPEVHASPYLANFPSNGDLDKSDRDARAQRVFSRGHCNPLASHPDLTTFADRPTPAVAHMAIPQGRTLSHTQIHQQDDGIRSLGGTSIYFPGSRSFNQYAQNTPPSVLGSTSLSSRKVRAAASQTPLLETPTRQSRKATGGRHPASKSKRDRPNTPPDEALPNSHEDEEFDINQTPRTKARVFHLRDLNGQGDSQPERVLKPKDQNVMSGDGFSNYSPVSDCTPTSASRGVVKDGFGK